MEYVEGISHDYVFSDGEMIEDYGSITNPDLVEIIGRQIKDPLLREYILKKLSNLLHVTLKGEKQLTQKEAEEIFVL